MTNSGNNQPENITPTRLDPESTGHARQGGILARRGPFYALSFRNFRLFFIGQIISVAGTWMQSVAQNWFVWKLTHDARWLGIVNGASALPFVMFTLWGGQLADRWSRRAILIWTQAGAMVLAFVLWAIALDRWVHPMAWHVALISALASVVNAFNMPAQQAFVTDMVDERDALSNAIALNSLRFNLARFVGPILAGIVLVRFSVAACFFVNGLSYIAVIVSLIMMQLPPHLIRENRVSVAEGFRYIGQHRNVLRIVLMVGIGAVLTWPVSTLFPVFATTQLHRGAGGYSALMSANGVGAALAGLVLAVIGDRVSRRLMIYGGAAVFSLSLIAFSSVTSYLLAMITVAVSGAAMILFGISANTRVQEEVPDELRGRVMAVYTLVFNGLFPLGGLEIGYLASKMNAPEAVKVDAGLALVIGAAVWLWSESDIRRARALPR